MEAILAARAARKKGKKKKAILDLAGVHSVARPEQLQASKPPPQGGAIASACDNKAADASKKQEKDETLPEVDARRNSQQKAASFSTDGTSISFHDVRHKRLGDEKSKAASGEEAPKKKRIISGGDKDTTIISTSSNGEVKKEETEDCRPSAPSSIHDGETSPTAATNNPTMADADARNQELGSDDEGDEGGMTGKSKSRRGYPAGAGQTLKGWLLSPEYFTRPYPTPHDQATLMAKTGIDEKQIENWFTNARRQIWKPMLKKEGKNSASRAAQTPARAGAQAASPAFPSPLSHPGAALQAQNMMWHQAQNPKMNMMQIAQQRPAQIHAHVHTGMNMQQAQPQAQAHALMANANPIHRLNVQAHAQTHLMANASPMPPIIQAQAQAQSNRTQPIRAAIAQTQAQLMVNEWAQVLAQLVANPNPTPPIIQAQAQAQSNRTQPIRAAIAQTQAQLMVNEWAQVLAQLVANPNPTPPIIPAQGQVQAQLIANANPTFPQQTSGDATVPPQANKNEQQRDPGSVVPCRARGMPSDHNLMTAHFVIPANVRHGEELICSYVACRNAGVKFRYCSNCKVPVARRNFGKRHRHGGHDKAKGVVDNENTSVVKETGSQQAELRSRVEKEDYLEYCNGDRLHEEAEKWSG